MMCLKAHLARSAAVRLEASGDAVEAFEAGEHRHYSCPASQYRAGSVAVRLESWLSVSCLHWWPVPG